MKKDSLQIRLTIMSCIILSLACIILTFTMNLSVSNAIEAPLLEPSQVIDPSSTVDMNKDETLIESVKVPKTPMYEIEEAKKIIRVESIFTMLAIIVIGSSITYVLVGRALKPVKKLTEISRCKRVDNLTEKIELPKIKDEVYDLTLAFNDMSEHLKQSFDLQKQFSADVAHELRTPLAAMQTKLEVYRLQNIDTDDLTSDLLKQTERLSKLIDDLIWFSKDTPLNNLQYVDINQLINDIAEELAIDENELNISENKLLIRGDDALLERVFYNIMQNAIKYGGKNLKISINIFSENKSIEICDNGSGIEDSEKKAIFEPFYRIDKSRSRDMGGNGLGLAICKKILDKHGASIEVLDNKPHGSIFKIKFSS